MRAAMRSASNRHLSDPEQMFQPILHSFGTVAGQAFRTQQRHRQPGSFWFGSGRSAACAVLSLTNNAEVA
jgi:hypothetical protein